MLLNHAVRGVCAIALMAVAGLAQGGSLGSPFLVSGTSPVAGRWPLDVTAGAGGDVALLYFDDAINGRFTRRYDSQGVGYTASDVAIGASGESVAVDRIGNHIVVGTLTGSPGIHARVFNRAGSLVVSQFRVDTNVSGTQSVPTVAANGDGTFVVVWTSNFGAASQQIQARQFNINGTPRSAMFTVASDSNTFIGGAHAAVDGSGNAFVVWQQRNFATPTGFSVWSRRFNSIGGALSSALRMDGVDGQALYPHVAMNPEGSSVMATWSSLNGNNREIIGQRFDVSGSKVGGNFVISSTSGNQQQNDVAMMDDGSFVVTWDNDDRSTVPSAIPAVRARQFNSAGAAVGAEFTVSDAANSSLSNVGMDLAGNFLVGWHRYNTGTAKWEIYARRYQMDTLPAITPLVKNVAQTGLSGAAGSWRYFRLNVPVGTPSFTLTMTGAGNADFLLRFAALPTATAFDSSPGYPSSNETLVVNSPPAGDFYVAIWGAASYSGVSLTASY